MPSKSVNDVLRGSVNYVLGQDLTGCNIEFSCAAASTRHFTELPGRTQDGEIASRLSF